MRTLVLGLGNELVADDALGPVVARALDGRLGPGVVVTSSSLHGLALLDVLSGYDAAVVVDAQITGRRAVGDVFEVEPGSLRPVNGASPHFSGLPELVALAGRLGLRFPARLRIVAMEVADLETLGGPMSPAVRAALPSVCDAVARAVETLAPAVP